MSESEEICIVCVCACFNVSLSNRKAAIWVESEMSRDRVIVWGKRVCVCVCVRVCVCVCVRVCECVCVCVCVLCRLLNGYTGTGVYRVICVCVCECVCVCVKTASRHLY